MESLSESAGNLEENDIGSEKEGEITVEKQKQ